MKLPLLISVPHAGLRVPPEAEPYCALTADQIAADGDVGAAEIYRIEPEVAAYLTTDIARAIVDLNRAADDRRRDGVVKTHTCWNEPVYDPPPPAEVLDLLLERYYRPYHARLRELAETGVKLGIDCHTMAAAGPPVGPDPGQARPSFCLGNADGTCPPEWIEMLAAGLAERSGLEVRINDPFRGGFITRSRPGGIPWMQMEMSRADFMDDDRKRGLVIESLQDFRRKVFP